MKKLFGEEIDKTSPVGGMDEEGEMEGAYRPTGHPGVCCIHLMKRCISDLLSSTAMVCAGRFPSIAFRFKASGNSSCMVYICFYSSYP